MNLEIIHVIMSNIFDLDFWTFPKYQLCFEGYILANFSKLQFLMQLQYGTTGQIFRKGKSIIFWQFWKGFLQWISTTILYDFKPKKILKKPQLGGQHTFLLHSRQSFSFVFLHLLLKVLAAIIFNPPFFNKFRVVKTQLSLIKVEFSRLRKDQLQAFFSVQTRFSSSWIFFQLFALLFSIKFLALFQLGKLS